MSSRSVKLFNSGGLARKLKLNGKMKKREIIEWLREAKNERSYTILTFDEVTLDAAIVADVLDLFRISSRSGRVWDRVNLEFCSGPIDLMVTSAMMMDCIKHLFLASDQTQDDLMERFSTTLRVNASLKSLWLLIPMTEKSAACLGNGLKHNRSIDKLSLSGCNWDPEDDSGIDGDTKEKILDETKKSQPQTSSIASSLSSFHDAPTALAQGLRLNSGIRTFDISCCYLQDEEIAPIIQSLVGHPFLEVLDVSRNLCRRKTLRVMADLVNSDESRLRTLDLREQARRNPLDISALSQALRVNDTLESLKLSHNRLVDEQVLDLADALRGNSTLQELDLQYNQITERGIPELTKHIKGISALAILLLGGNTFGTEGFNLLEKLDDDDDSICTVNEEDMKNKAKREKREGRASSSAKGTNYFGFLTGITE
jgi:hypothetical protein